MNDRFDRAHGDLPEPADCCSCQLRTVRYSAAPAAPPTAQDRQIPYGPLVLPSSPPASPERASPQVGRLRNHASLGRPRAALRGYPHADGGARSGAAPEAIAPARARRRMRFCTSGGVNLDIDDRALVEMNPPRPVRPRAPNRDRLGERLGLIVWRLIQVEPSPLRVPNAAESPRHLWVNTEARCCRGFDHPPASHRSDGLRRSALPSR